MASFKYRVATLAILLIGTLYLIVHLRSYDHAKFMPTYPFYISRNPLMRQIGEPSGILTRSTSFNRANATLMSLVRNEELDDLLTTMEDVEKTFNSKFNYPWTFLNDVPFSAEFKNRTRAATSANVYYELIPSNQWQDPSWIDQSLKNASADFLAAQGVQYSSETSYHRMCRWNSGMFYHHPRLQNFRYYWRIEPKTHYFCSIDYDVFKYMEDNGKTYGFVINIYDNPQSVASLWPTTLEFILDNPQYVHPNNALGWLTDAEKRPKHNHLANGYSTCHFWSNFEIGDMDFWRSEAYENYFKYLDQSGGFFYERWGDAPVHSIGLGLFLDKSKIHWFKDIGYQHIPYFNCPNSPKCSGCQPGLFSDGTGLSSENCFSSWVKYGGTVE